MTIIKDMRLERDLTQAECASRCIPPCTQPQWSMWEERGPKKLKTLWRVCGALDVDSGEVQEMLKGQL